MNKLESLLNQGAEITPTTVLSRGVYELLPKEEVTGLKSQMEEGRIKLYLGIDPTGPELHLGHSVPIRKLRQFQELGHEVVLLFGTFTGMIGDPTDKSATRKKLTPEDISTNMRTYQKQAGKILDLSPESTNPIQIAENHTWLKPLDFSDVLEIAASFSVQQLLKRDMFQVRMEEGKPLNLTELLYPLMQGYDSVALGVDLEVGGKDQIFNMMVGRDLVKERTGKSKSVMGTKLIEDPSGKKMGKTAGNVVGILEDSAVKYEAVMTWPDSAVPLGFELLTYVPLEEVDQAVKEVESGVIHPNDFKKALAHRVVSELDGQESADEAAQEYDNVYRNRQLPSRIKEGLIEPGTTLSVALVALGLSATQEEAAKKIAEGAVLVNGERIKASWTPNTNSDGSVIQIGRRTIKNIRRITTS
jgi:tyrosyl-tRNA synthetase